MAPSLEAGRGTERRESSLNGFANNHAGLDEGVVRSWVLVAVGDSR